MNTPPHEHTIEFPERQDQVKRVLAAALIAVAVPLYLSIRKFERRVTVRSPLQRDAATLAVRESALVVRGAEIYDITSRGEQLLFTNVKNVSDVRRGPDGNTVHFRFSNPESDQASCANPVVPIETAWPDYDNPPPVQAPWDYQRVAWAYTIAGCGDHGTAGGYLKRSAYFAYITVTPANNVSLVLEDLQTHTTQTFPLVSTLFANLLRGREDAGYELQAFEGPESVSYYYPVEDALLADGKLVIAFARLLLAVDPQQQGRLIGHYVLTNPPYDIISNAFRFYANDSSPFVVIESAWEGRLFVALVDVSSDTLRIESLPIDEQPVQLGYQTPLVEWDTAGMTLHFYKEEDISHLVHPEEIAFFNRDPETPEEPLDARTTEIEQRLEGTGRYIEVLCSYSVGIGDSSDVTCFGLTKGKDYRITPGSGLREI